MFERYTEKSRRVIFFARYEASQWGADHIGTTHLLLAILREDRGLTVKVFGSSWPFFDPAEALGLKQTGKKVSTSVDMPLTEEAKSVLAIAAEESEQLHQKFVMPGHILLGIMKQPDAAGQFLKSSGLDLDKVRKVVVEMDPPGTYAIQRMEEAAPAILDPNRHIVAQLRTQFKLLTSGLKPEMEPAVVYRLDK
jgi:ATP-dependent Clp protease ATP-binding subunit ClpC